MLAALPIFAQVLLLGVLGLATGVFINWAIYRWAMLQRRSISPFLSPNEDAGESPRRLFDFVPILGWPGRARDSQVYGRGFWFRPMAIELVWMIGLPWFYFWLAGGGLVELQPPQGLVECWFWLYAIFLALMTIGTFIDFDEKTIPDEVTVTGTLIALLFATFAPGFGTFAPGSRLPIVTRQGMAAPSIESLDHGIREWHSDWLGLVVALLIFAIWIWALLPKLPVLYVGFRKCVRFMYAHAFRPKRKTKCKLRVRERAMPVVTKFLVALLLVGLAGITGVWLFYPSGWLSLYGSLVGLAFGGCLIWSIRIIGTYAMQQEAMGFGDVTLMAMIGATLGWQATLIAFVYAMIVVVLALVIQILATGSQALAFGPYLCAGAALTIFRWKVTWPFAEKNVFALGDFVWWMLGASAVLMAVMLLGIQWIKGMLGIGEYENESEKL